MIKRTFSLNNDDIKRLKELSEREGTNQSAVIRKAIKKAYYSNTEEIPKNDAQNSDLVEILTSQIETKDEQIKTLSDQLSDAQENLKNEQILHGRLLESPQMLSRRERRRRKKEAKRQVKATAQQNF